MSPTPWARPYLKLGDDHEPWERLHGESNRAWAAFVTYRDLGLTRSLRACAREMGIAVSTVADWSKHNQWVIRAEAFDRWMDAEKRRSMVKRQEQALMDQATVAQALIGIVAQRLSGPNALPIGSIRASDIPRWLLTGATVQRAALGIPTRIHTEGSLTLDGKVTIDDATSADRLASQFDAYFAGRNDADRDSFPTEESHHEVARGDA